MVTAGAAQLSARQQQERRVVDAVRQLLDEGVQDPSIDEISRCGRMSKAIIYRHVSSKEELYLLALCSYQEEFAAILQEIPETMDPQAQLNKIAHRYIAFCQRYPAYVDCTAGLHRQQTMGSLSPQVAPALLQRVTAVVAAVNTRITRALAAGRDKGVFDIPIDNLDLVTWLIYTAILGVMQGARQKVGIREGASGHPEVFPIARDDITRILLIALSRLVGVTPPDHKPRSDT
jgi:AcrR family transcriptional regulator